MLWKKLPILELTADRKLDKLKDYKQQARLMSTTETIFPICRKSLLTVTKRYFPPKTGKYKIWIESFRIRSIMVHCFHSGFLFIAHCQKRINKGEYRVQHYQRWEARIIFLIRSRAGKVWSPVNARFEGCERKSNQIFLQTSQETRTTFVLILPWFLTCRSKIIRSS